jgi:hypothetical protein
LFCTSPINAPSLGLVFVKPTTENLELLLKMVDDSSARENGNDSPSHSPQVNGFPASEHGKETSSISPIDNMLPEAALQKSNTPPSAVRENVFMIFITLTQLVQMIPLGAGINSGLAIGEALGATPIESVWIVASYPLTQGAFVLIGKCLPHRFRYTARWNGMTLTICLLIRWPSGRRVWSQEYILCRLCVVGSLGFVWWILQ